MFKFKTNKMKKILYVIISLLAVYLILCFLGKSEAKVERSISINSSPEAVKANIADHKVFHEKWSPWTEKDPQMKVTFEGNAGESGQKMAWVSDKEEVGKGSMTLNSITGDSIIQTLHFDDFGDSKIYHTVKSENSAVKVTWGMQSQTPFLLRGMMMFMNMEEMIAPDFEKGLVKLKTHVESAPSSMPVANYEVKELDWTETNFIGSKREIVAVKDEPAFFSKNLPVIAKAIEKEKIQMLSTPVAIYFSFDEKEMKGDMATGFKVANGVKLKGFENYTFISSKVLHVAYYGNYDKISAAHYAISDYIKVKNLPQQSVAIEEYITDPTSEKDTTKWLTNVYYLLPGTR